MDRSANIQARAIEKPDILSVVHRFPYPPDKGDRIRAFHQLRVLSQRANIHMACLADEPPPPGAVETLGRYCEALAVVPIGRHSRLVRAASSLLTGGTATEGAFHSKTLRKVVEDWSRSKSFHAALASSSGMVQYLESPDLAGVRRVVDLVDVDSQKWLDYAEVEWGPRAWLHRLEGNRLRDLERKLPDRTFALTLVSEAEAVLFRRIRAAGNVQVVRLGVDLSSYQPIETPDESGCVFVGALDYRPNVDGACWFCREVWPSLRSQHPGVTLQLVGRRPTGAVSRLGGLPGVEVVGQVPDVRPYLAGAAVALAPLRIARGVQSKVLEALAMGKAVVASPAATAGLATVAGRDLLTAGSPAEWVAGVGRLLLHEPDRRAFGRAGRRYVEEQHAWDACIEPLAAMLGLPHVAPSEPETCLGSVHGLFS